MAAGNPSSSGSKLLEMQGTLRISSAGLPDLGCLLTDLRFNGCRATVMFQFLPEDVAAQWRDRLQSQNPK